MDDVGPDMRQSIRQRGKIVVVIPPVETNWIDQQLIAVGVTSFERHTAAGVIPAGRDDGCQLNVGKAGNGFQLRLVGTHQAGLG